MKRREFIAGLGGAAAWPLVARAQQPERMRRVFFLHALAANDPETQGRILAFQQALEALGWIENRNIQIEHRFAAGDFDLMRAHSAELAALAPDVAVASSSSVIRAIRQATANIPIVFNLVNDPVGQGFVAGLAHPGGNITGFTFMDPPIVGKWQEMLKEIAPSIRRTTLMFNPYTVPYYPKWLHELAVPATAKPSEMPVHDEVEIEAATKAFAREPGGGLIVAGDPFTNAHRTLIMKVAEQHRLPAIYNFRQFVIEGGLISYGPDSFDVVRRSASYVDRILKGTSPADLPVQAPTKYELVINLHAAKALGLDVPQMLLVRADEVIE
jgi:ABC-type uncharacterized transport system substrate-binding protein